MNSVVGVRDSHLSLRKRTTKKFSIAPEQVIHYLGTVNYATTERVLELIKERLPLKKEIVLMVTSAGGPTGTAMSFYDTVRYVLKIPLTTIGSGDVDSSGILIFLAGTKRYITPHTTLLLHPAGRIFDGIQRYTTREVSAMLREDQIKDMQYASVIAEASEGTLTVDAILTMMEAHTILTAEDLVKFNLAKSITDPFILN